MARHSACLRAGLWLRIQDRWRLEVRCVRNVAAIMRGYDECAMNSLDVVAKVGQILDEERIHPTVGYKLTAPFVNATAPVAVALGERGKPGRSIQEKPGDLVFNSSNFDF